MVFVMVRRRVSWQLIDIGRESVLLVVEGVVLMSPVASELTESSRRVIIVKYHT